jgi:hypothetical protein
MEFEGYDEPALEQTEETVLKLSETIVKQETGKTVSFSIQIEKQPSDIKENQEEAIKPTSELKENEEAAKGISEDTLEAVPLNLSLETKAVKTQIRMQDSDVEPDSETEMESDRKNIDMQGLPCLVIKGPQKRTQSDANSSNPSSPLRGEDKKKATNRHKKARTP